MMPKYNIAHQRILNFIADENISVKSKLPPEKELADRLGFSMITIRRALQELEKGNFIERVHGRGTFLKTEVKNRQNSGKILFISIGYTSETQYSSGYQTVEEEIIRQGYRLQYLKVPEEPDASVLEHLPDCSGILLYGWINAGWIDFLKPAGIPLLAFGNNPCRDKISTVYYEYYTGTRKLMDELISRGARKIGYTGRSNTKNPSSNDIFRAYHDALSENGLEINPERWFHKDYGPTQYYTVIRDFLKANPDLDALVIIGTDIYVNMLNYFMENNVKNKPLIGVILQMRTYQLEHASLKNTVLLIPDENIYYKAAHTLFDQASDKDMTINFKVMGCEK
ncbi:MAG: hypothetical protein A2017_00265 [Lentisphaerae bacterium GWF2_44_16]|nr:MAG: hypothetical protein A2017_00265 [Lentisphaerae bacterium GWF2_44_16]